MVSGTNSRDEATAHAAPSFVDRVRAIPAQARSFKLSPINQRRWRNFNANRRGASASISS